jgi:hypothetical protein
MKKTSLGQWSGISEQKLAPVKNGDFQPDGF